MKKMVIDGACIYSGKSFSDTAIKKIRDGGIVELGYSSCEGNEQWIEVLEDNFFIGFINSKTKLVDLNNYCYVIEDNLFCYEQPDYSSGIAVCLSRYEKIYLISKLFNRGQLWLKVYDSHGFCCYIVGNSRIFPNKFGPYLTTLGESTIMYVTSLHKDTYKTIHLKKRSFIYVKRLIAYRHEIGLDTDSHPLHSEDFFKNIGYSDDIWLEICAHGLTGYISAITKTCRSPFIDHLPNEHLISNSNFQDNTHHNISLIAPGIISIIAGTLMFSLLPSLSFFAVYFWILGLCLITLKLCCS